MSKIKLKYNKAALPENFSDTLDSADENDLRVMLGIMFSADGDGDAGEDSELSEKIGLDAAETSASLKFWCGAGYISLSRGAKKKQEAASRPKTTPKAPKTEKFPSAHKGGAVERSGELSSYSSKELADLIESKKVTSEFIDEAMRITGKPFTTTETGILAGLVDQLGYEEEAVLTILAHAYKNGKKSLRYAEKLAFGLHDDGIVDTDNVHIKLSNLEKSREIGAKVQKMFGMQGRELTTKEKGFLSNWVEKYGYGEEEIRLAFDITVDTTQGAHPAYTNAIIEKWYSAGLRTAAEIRRFSEKEKSERSDGNAKSFDIDEFFDAAMKRYYDSI